MPKNYKRKTVYECKVCAYTTESMKDIRGHVKIPVQTVPSGLVINYAGIPWVLLRDGTDYNHIAWYRQIPFFSKRYKVETTINTLIVNEEVLRGWTSGIKLYSEQEFEGIRKKLEQSFRKNRQHRLLKLRLKRTTPQLEELVRKAEAESERRKQSRFFVD